MTTKMLVNSDMLPVNVEHYPSIQAALDAASPGASVYCRLQDYEISAPLSITKSVRLFGDPGTTIHTASAIDLVTINPATDGAVIQFDGLMFDGGTNGLNYTRNGYISRASYIRDCAFSNQTAKPIATVTGMIGTYNGPIHIEGPSQYGLWSQGEGLLGSSFWNAVRVTGTAVAALYIEHTLDGADQPAITFLNPILESNSGKGLDNRLSKIVLHNPHFESNGSTAGADIDMRGGGTTVAETLLLHGYFSNAGAGQSNVRIFFADNRCRYSERWVRHPSSDVLNANGKTAGSIIDLSNAVNPTITNYADANLHRRTFANGTVVLTANLPAAAASLDGTWMLEDAGSNACNLVGYKGGKRFKVSLTES